MEAIECLTTNELIEELEKRLTSFVVVMKREPTPAEQNEHGITAQSSCMMWCQFSVTDINDFNTLVSFASEKVTEAINNG